VAPPDKQQVNGRVDNLTMRKRVGFSLLLFVSIATAAAAQSPSEAHDSYVAVQAGLGAASGSDPLPNAGNQIAYGVDLGQSVHRDVTVYSNLRLLDPQNYRWQRTLYYTGGAKYLFPTSPKVRPYVLAGIGGLHISDRTVAGITVSDGFDKFVAEFGGGIEVTLGQRGYFDAGFRHAAVPGPQEPFAVPDTNNALVAFGIRF
jgi:hypothetical protein